MNNIDFIIYTFQNILNDVKRTFTKTSNEDDVNTDNNVEMKPLILTKIIKSSPEEDTSGPISPPPLKPNMAHKAW